MFGCSYRKTSRPLVIVIGTCRMPHVFVNLLCFVLYNAAEKETKKQTSCAYDKDVA